MLLVQILVLVVLAALGGWLLTVSRQRRLDAAIHAAVQTFGPAQAAVQRDPRELLVWQPLAEANRRLFPEAFAALDQATGRRFPFPPETIERAHAKWTATWLTWEKVHDEEYRLKAATVEHEMHGLTGDSAMLAKARLQRVQHEKLERYQERYEEYIQTAKALQALLQ
jgi:hypothetical protein